MLASLAVNAVFNVRGRKATYAAPGGSATPCTVVEDRSDRTVSGVRGRMTTEGFLFKVRASEVAQPVKGGQFTIIGESYKVTSDPLTEDAFRLVWICTVAPIVA